MMSDVLPFEFPDMPAAQLFTADSGRFDPIKYLTGIAEWETECRRICSENGYRMTSVQDVWIIEPNEQPKDQSQLAPQQAAQTEREAVAG